MNFTLLKTAVQRQFNKMKDKTLLKVNAHGDALWAAYLDAFPDGMNPKFRERTDHDCSCCRHFVRSLGGIVYVEGERLVTIWDFQVEDPGYQVVADRMAAFVRAYAIENIFLSNEAKVGTDKNFEEPKVEGGEVRTWEHFFLHLPPAIVSRDLGPKLGDARATHDVMLRSLTEIDLDTVNTVLELIGQNGLYRGEEHRASVQQFRDLKLAFAQASNADLFCWDHVKSVGPSVARIRNTAIGTLLVDIAEGKELDEAVKSFEAKVAPANYKRPTALVTKAMIAKAKAKVDELGLTSALDRRYANLDDIAITDIIFADRETRKKLDGNVFDEISPTKPTTAKKLDKVDEIGIDDFIRDVVPTATSIEAMVENGHTSRLVSLISPCDLTARRLFKWDNNFSWTYAGDFADSIKERVKSAGGNVTGDLRCSLSWFNFDDLDLHMIEPGGYEIFYGNRHTASPNRGMLDVDMNASGGQTREAVENICYESRRSMKAGVYALVVNQFNKRESIDVGFEVEIEFDGTVHTIAYPKAVGNRENVVVAKIGYSPSKGFEILESLPSTQIGKDVWGVRTQEFVPVSALMLSPNHWSGQGVGNRHFFFMLKGCKNSGTARGFYNEFLTPELNEHRKVLEIVGAKMQTKEADAQLSGLGFSSTQRGYLLCRVKGSFTRIVKVLF